MPNEMSNEELASKLEKVLPGNYYIVEAASRIREFANLRWRLLIAVDALEAIWKDREIFGYGLPRNIASEALRKLKYDFDNGEVK